MRPTATHGAEPLGLAQRLGADDQARDAEAYELVDGRFVANAAAELDRHVDRLANGFDTGHVRGLAASGAVEVDQVQAAGPFGDPMFRHRGGVIAENGFLGVIALP